MLNVEFLGANGSLQERGGGNTSLLISSDDTDILVDVSSNVYEAAERDIDYVYVTHSHIDHVYALPSLLHQLWIKGRVRELTVFAPEKVIPLLENLIKLFSLREKKGFFPLRIEAARKIEEGSIEIEPFITNHTDASIGLLFTDKKEGKKILYTSDTRPIKDIDEKWINADLLIHESSGLVEEEEVLIRKGHSSAFDAASLAKRINSRKLILCHLPLGEDKKKRILEEGKRVFDQTSLPEVLMVYSV